MNVHHKAHGLNDHQFVTFQFKIVSCICFMDASISYIRIFENYEIIHIDDNINSIIIETLTLVSLNIDFIRMVILM